MASSAAARARGGGAAVVLGDQLDVGIVELEQRHLGALLHALGDRRRLAHAAHGQQQRDLHRRARLRLPLAGRRRQRGGRRFGGSVGRAAGEHEAEHRQRAGAFAPANHGLLQARPLQTGVPQ